MLPNYVAKRRLQINKPHLKPRILLIEDDPLRIEKIQNWLKDTDFVMIEASSGGKAKGILRKNMTDGIAGVMLDHDLEKQRLTSADMTISGTDLINGISQSMPKHIPVLVHSMNDSKSPLMAKKLTQQGYCVTKIKMEELTKAKFDEWLEEVADVWEDFN